MRPRLRASIAVLAVVAVVAAGCRDPETDGGPSASGPPTTMSADAATEPTTEPSSAGAPERVDDTDALYAVPDPIPDGEHGDLLRYQEIEPSGVTGTRAYRVMYLSESLAGEPIVVTGTIVVPDEEAPDDGRIVFAIAHGTTGVADECAPSRGRGAAELQVAAAAVERGWIVAVTDYEGLGTPGRHPYLVGESEGRSVIDSVLAAGGLPDAERSDTTLIAGYSQGGHGSLWANQVAPEWAPDLDVVGTFAGAPASEIDLILGAAGSPGAVGFAYLVIAGFAAAYPEADPALILTDEGVGLLDAVDEGCVSAVFGALAGIPPADIVRPDGPSTAPWPELALRNNPGQVGTDAPILIIHSEQDDVVPIVLSAILFDRMCGLGQHAERRVLPDGGGHGPAATIAYPQAVEWFDALLAGETVDDTCP